MTEKQTIILGTRASKLALWQAEHVASLLQDKFPVQIELKKITTKGDLIQDRSLAAIGGKGLFLKEIEDALLVEDVDIAVHSMKDVPYSLPEGLVIAALLPRENPTDAFVSNEYSKIEDLPEGAVVGTSSVRRHIQLKQKFPHLKFTELRGNVDTRLKKLDEGQFSAIILASAGLRRLGLNDRIKQELEIISAVGQGAIGIECRQQDEKVAALLKQLNDPLTAEQLKWERLFSSCLEGSCQTPLGAHVKVNGSEIHFSYFYGTADGSKTKSGELVFNTSSGQQMISDLAHELKKEIG